jgi:hypothetical protein
MRILIGAVVALSFASAAFAQTDPAPPPAAPVAANSQCAIIGPEPTLPDPATATPAAISATNQAYTTWATGAQESARCRQAEIQPLQARVNAMTEEHNAIVARLNALTQTWVGVTETYCAREGVRCERTQR